MGITSLSPLLRQASGFSMLLAPVSALTAFFVSTPSMSPHIRHSTGLRSTTFDRKPVLFNAKLSEQKLTDSEQKLSPVRCLKIIRHVEAGAIRSCSGKLYISGRMADVCAALDRLTSCEAHTD